MRTLRLAIFMGISVVMFTACGAVEPSANNEHEEFIDAEFEASLNAGSDDENDLDQSADGAQSGGQGSSQQQTHEASIHQIIVGGGATDIIVTDIVTSHDDLSPGAFHALGMMLFDNTDLHTPDTSHRPIMWQPIEFEDEDTGETETCECGWAAIESESGTTHRGVIQDDRVVISIRDHRDLQPQDMRKDWRVGILVECDQDDPNFVAEVKERYDSDQNTQKPTSRDQQSVEITEDDIEAVEDNNNDNVFTIQVSTLPGLSL